MSLVKSAPAPAKAAPRQPKAPVAIGLEAPRELEAARQRIFEAARMEFADKGLAGARIDLIAEVARSNKRMIYYYFDSKEALYLAVLEDAYIEMRRNESALALGSLAPSEAIAELVRFKFKHYEQRPYLIGLLAGENMLGARYLRQSQRLRELHASLVDTITQLLRQGAQSGEFRADVDPLELYMSIAALSYFYFSNRATLATAFGKALDTPKALARRREHAVDVILGYLRP
jgi:AcrR family transcriptional regulator